MNNIYINPLLLPMLNGKERFNIAYGGRSSGKSWGISDILLIKSMTEKDIIILCSKGTMKSINDSVKSLLERQIKRHGWEDFFYITKMEIVCTITNSKFIFSGLINPERIKSIEDVKYLWIEEAAVEVSQEAIDILIPTLRTKGNRLFMTLNPKFEEDPVYKQFIANHYHNTNAVKILYTDNPHCSDETIEEAEFVKSRDIAKYNHIYLGEIMQEVEGALWSTDLITHADPEHIQELINSGFDGIERIVVAVDPATTDKSTSDACGIIVIGKYANQDKYIVLEELSRICSPNQWSDIAIKAYDKYKADRIVAETNQGGDMVETIIKNKRRNIAYKGVHASKGKIARAEPVAALYEEYKVSHAHRMANLEFEMVTFTGERNEKSPNSLDALVWGLTELSAISKSKRRQIIWND